MNPMTYADQMKMWEKRRAKLQALRDKGWTIRRIAEQEGLSIQRVAQITKRKDGTDSSTG